VTPLYTPVPRPQLKKKTPIQEEEEEEDDDFWGEKKKSGTQSSLMSKFQELMEKPPSPKVCGWSPW
jgi:hypothetical protein